MSTRRLIIALSIVAALVSCSPSGEESPDSSSAIDPGHDGAHLGLEPASVMGRPDRVIAGPQGNDGQFLVECDLSHVASDDPILFPDQPGASHIHAFFGNRETSAASRPAELVGNETSCDDSLDSAAYWVPVLVDGSTVVAPVFGVAYYRAGPDVDPTTVVAYPPGLMMIAGDPTPEGAQPIEVVSWGCGAGARRSALPPVCPTGSELSLSVAFPDCWDGDNVDTPGHRGHVRYSTGGNCPDSHPVPIPQLVFIVNYPVDGDTTDLRLSSGTLGSGHADFVNAWDQDRLENLVELCIREQHVCAISSGRRPI